MKILFDNVNFDSRSGPNGFAKKLAVAVSKLGHQIADPTDYDACLAFIQAHGSRKNLVQRLDGIWFNSEQDWKKQNKSIKETYKQASAVIFQSEFNKKLVTNFFGEHDNSFIVRNGTDVDLIESTEQWSVPALRGVDKVWVCASSWRPHKRLKENIRYFLEHSGENDCLIIAGANPDVRISNPRIFYAGDLNYNLLLGLFKSADYFIHLAWLDHCPNVVVDAHAAGATVICSSSGGTQEIAGIDAIVIKEDEWDFKPCKLYEPPCLDFTKVVKNTWDLDSTITSVAEHYVKILKDASNELN